MNPTIQAIVDLVTAAGVIYLAVRMERFIGYIKALETALNAHVNAPGNAWRRCAAAAIRDD